MKTINIESFVLSYLITAAWVTVEGNENDEFTDEAKEIAKNDCLQFIDEVKAEFGEEKAIELLTVRGAELDYLAPHDFFLTRNGHGAGFWDRPEKYQGQEIADRLTAICEKIGSVDCYHVKGKRSKLTF